MDSSERGMNPVTMTIINPQREYWPSWRLNQRPPVLKSATLLTELCSPAYNNDSTLSQQALVFTCLQYKSFENTVGKRAISPFPTVFSTHLDGLSAIFVEFEIVVCLRFQSVRV